MLNKRTQVICRCTEANTPWEKKKVWTKASDVKFRFFEIFEFSGKLTHRLFEADWQKLPHFQEISRADVIYVMYITCAEPPLCMWAPLTGIFA